MSLLTVVQNVCRAIGKSPPSVVATSTDAAILELFVLSSTSGQELARGYDFPELLKENSWSATSTVNQSALIGVSASAVVSSMDYERMVPDTFWNRTQDEQYQPATNAEWSQWSAVGTIPVPKRFIILNKNLYVGPNTGPTSGDVLAFMYYSAHWCSSSEGVGKRAWSADTDIGVIPEPILERDLIWRWKQAKGLPYAEDLETSERAINKYTGSAGGRRLLMLGGGSTFNYAVNIPEGNWGV